MTTKSEIAGGLHRMARAERVRAAFYRGGDLTLENPLYLRAVRTLTDELLREDTEPTDLTVEAMDIDARPCTVEIRAKEAGVIAGVSEAAWIYERSRHGSQVTMTPIISDGSDVAAGEAILRVAGNARTLLTLERTVVNLLQRMGGIATATKKLAGIAREASRTAHVVGTRKTAWGLLDKRAIHCGGGGTHRLNLGDAILIKTNHLRLASNGTSDLTADRAGAALDAALRRAWERRKSASFFEIEVTSMQEALAVARSLGELQASSDACPCILMLDNFSAADAGRAVQALSDARLHDAVLVEASGNVSGESVAAYAAAGVDAISIGALTHSVRALDLSAKILPEAR
ncbi:MAG: carboxylating nicotinate-nucleotide diphosphorylase [Candidatus Acidiferrales bacterium]